MQLWRISDYRSLSGEGGMLYSARWHTKGKPILYLAASPAGAMLEVLVHLELDESRLPRKNTLLQVDAPDEVSVHDLADPENGTVWRGTLGTSRKLGNKWLAAGASALAKVPSSIVPHTWNYLLNPLHPDAKQLKISSAITGEFDSRLVSR